MFLAEPREQTIKRTVALAGEAGLVGRSILEGLLADLSVSRFMCWGGGNPASPTRGSHFTSLISYVPALPPVDEVYLALGTTIKVAGSQAAFRAVDFDANLLWLGRLLPRVRGAGASSARWARTRSPGCFITG